MTFFDITAADYHADRFGEEDRQPSLSSGIARLLLAKSPRHAWFAHPRLNPNYQEKHEPKFDVGTVAHQVLLEGNANIVVVEANDWRTKAAKDTRELAVEDGLTALLAGDWENVLAMVAVCRSQLHEVDVDPVPFRDGKPEQCIVWHEPNGVCCRALIDWLHDGGAHVSDYKTTRASANPEQWTRNRLYEIGADVQVAFYSRGLERLTGVRPEWRYVVQETYPPYELSVIGLAPSVLEFGAAKVDRAIELWARCLERDEWPGYPRRVAWAELPAWEEARWLEREAREEVEA